ncbi:hypothetical protein GCM10009795_077590 [Nocardioides hankookensis]
MVNLKQIKANIAARKAMPAWGPQTSIERIKTINATLPSFSLKTVEALVEMLEKAQRANAAQDDHINQQQNRIDQLENTNAEIGRRLYQCSTELVATLDVQSGRSDGNKFALAYSSAAHELPDDVYFLYCRARPASVVPDDTKLRELFDSWFASDCSFDRSPEASEADNIAWRESYWYVWQRCGTAILSSSRLEGL